MKWNVNSDGQDEIIFECEQAIGFINLSQLYPFSQPCIKFKVHDHYYSVINFEDYREYDQYFKHIKWSPQLTIKQITINCQELLNTKLQIRQPYQLDIYSDLSCKIRQQTNNATLWLFMALCVTLVMQLNPIEDFNKIKNYMMFTNRNQISDWKMPHLPIYAYFHWIMGLIHQILSQFHKNPQNNKDNNIQYIIQNDEYVIQYVYYFIANVVLFYPLLVCALRKQLKKYNVDLQCGIIFYATMCPLYLGISCLNVGLLITAIQLLQYNVWLGSIMYTIAINYDTDSLGLILGMICYIIGRVAEDNKVISIYSLKLDYSKVKYMLIELLGITMIATVITLIIWGPYIQQDIVIDVIYELIAQYIDCHGLLWQLLGIENLFIILGVFLICIIPCLYCILIDQKCLFIGLLATYVIQLLVGFGNTNTSIVTCITLIFLNVQTICEMNNIVGIFISSNNAYSVLYYYYGIQFNKQNQLNIRQCTMNNIDVIRDRLYLGFLVIRILCNWMDYSVVVVAIQLIVLLHVLWQCICGLRRLVLKHGSKRKLE